MPHPVVPLVSVCIPTYRGAAHLCAAIDSVLEQSLRDFELIVIDDNSPDDTADIIARYGDSRIRYLRNESNLGPEGNWNRCLDEARGRYVKLLPQDDILYQDTLRQQVRVMEEDIQSRLVLVFGARDIVDADGRRRATRGCPGIRDGTVGGLDLVRRCVLLGTNLIGEPGGVLFRRALVEKVGAFDASFPYVIDLDYWVRLLSHGDAYYRATSVCAFRVSSGSWSVAIGAGQGDQYCRFVDRLSCQPGLRLSTFDVMVGHLMARLNNMLRLVFYRLILR